MPQRTMGESFRNPADSVGRGRVDLCNQLRELNERDDIKEDVSAKTNSVEKPEKTIFHAINSSPFTNCLSLKHMLDESDDYY